MQTADIGVVILAAGRSSRLGQPKQLVAFRKKTLLQHVLDEASQIKFSTRLLILGAHAEEILAKTDTGNAAVVQNEQWEEGMASSLRLGVQETLEAHPYTEHILFLLSDQPFVSAKLLEELIRIQIEGSHKITASQGKDRMGVPAIFARSLFPSLLRLEGDEGGRQLLRKHKAFMGRVTFEGWHFDVDTPEDLERLKQLEKED